MAENIINHIRHYLIDLKSWQSRDEYLQKLPEDEAARIKGLESLFYAYPVGDPAIQLELQYRSLSFLTPVMEDIQKEFYLTTWSDHIAGKDSWDHKELVMTKNTSYQFLLDDRFEKELEASLRLRKRDEFREFMDNLRIENQEEVPIGQTSISPTANNNSGFLVRMLPYAAAACFIIFLLWQPFHDTDNAIFRQYSTLGGPELVVIAGQGSEDLRDLSDDHFAGLNLEEKSKASEAYELFYRKEYPASVSAFESAGISKDKGAKLLIFKAVAQLRMENYDSSAVTLDIIIGSSNNPYKEDAIFYRSLVHIAKGERADARRLLKMIRGDKGRLANQATEVLSKLRWF